MEAEIEIPAQARVDCEPVIDVDVVGRKQGHALAPPVQKVAYRLPGILHVSQQEIRKGKADKRRDLGVSRCPCTAAEVISANSIVFAAVHSPGLEVAAELETVASMNPGNSVADAAVVLHVTVGVGRSDRGLAHSVDGAAESDRGEVLSVRARDAYLVGVVGARRRVGCFVLVVENGERVHQAGRDVVEVLQADRSVPLNLCETVIKWARIGSATALPKAAGKPAGSGVGKSKPVVRNGDVLLLREIVVQFQVEVLHRLPRIARE